MPVAVGTARYVRAASGLLVRDGFGRADSAAALGRAETGQPWTVGNATDAATLPTWGITGGKAVAVATGTQNDAHAWAEANAADGIRIACRVGVNTAASAGICGLVFRRQDASNYLCLRLNNSADTIALFRNLAGVRTTIKSQALTLADGQVVQVELLLQGPNITVKADGVTQYVQADANFTGATKHGLYVNNSVLGATWDDFQVSAL